jgi:hypothetical protein
LTFHVAVKPQVDSSMTVPQPFHYQGNQRALAALILHYLPISTTPLLASGVARPSPGRTPAWNRGSSTVPVRVSGTGGNSASRGGTPLQAES